MDLGAWQKHKLDAVRARRLAVGYVTGAVLISGVLGTVAATAAKAYGLAEETVVEAALVDTAKDEPEVVVKEEQHVEARPQKAKTIAPIVEPTKMDTKLVEKEPTVKSDNPFAGEDPYALMQAAEERPAEERPKAQEAPKILEKPKAAAVQKEAAAPVRMTEDMTPAKADPSNAKAVYPEAAKAAGIEGTVVIRYTITETGAVTDVRAVSGPPELIAYCLGLVKSWHFSTPALDKDGHPVAMPKVARFPFHIKT